MTGLFFPLRHSFNVNIFCAYHFLVAGNGVFGITGKVGLALEFFTFQVLFVL